ncbi:glycosyltransferase family 2 protein [Thermodesulfitimonas sp.]
MLCAVVPAHNEAGRVGKVITKLLSLPVDLVIVVVNGSTDGTWTEVKHFPPGKIKPVFYAPALGVDVPRAVGAAYALKLGAKTAPFVDGDMHRVPLKVLRQLAAAVTRGLDMGLTDCYPPDTPPAAEPLVQQIVAYRRELNEALGLAHLRAASPSHGPHAVSRRFLETVPLEELAVPPVALCLAARAGLRIGVAAYLPHVALGSPPRSPLHSLRIGATIIGNYLEALAICRELPRSREKDGVCYDGYNSARRRDLLVSFLREINGPA